MDEFTNVFETATKRIGQDCFMLPIDGAPAVYKERVYCYELYHQMRLAWPKNCPYVVNGEVDKRNHPIFRQLGIENVSPDFLVHIPGRMEDNHAIIEVKRPDGDMEGMEIDIKKLSDFVRLAGYRRAIYLIFGEGKRGENQIVNRIEIAKLVVDPAPFELWLHRQVGKSAERVF